jgi:hypothetical protein
MPPDRRRPLGEPAPRRTGLGFLSFVLLACLLPLAISMAIGEWSPRGAEAWLDRLWWNFLLSAMIYLPPLLGWAGWRSYWAICWFWIGGVILLAAYLPCLAIAAAVPLGWRRIGVPDEKVLAYYALALVLLCLPACWGLFRMLTLRYFQPWTRPDQWESGDYRAPGWAMAGLRITRPYLAAEIERNRAERDRKTGARQDGRVSKKSGKQ